MNVFQLISSSGFFGAENVLVLLTSELQRDKYCNAIVGVIENKQNPHLEVAEECKKAGIETYIFPCRGKFDFKTIAQLRQFIRDRKIDIIHSHGYKENYFSFCASYGMPISLISTCHNWLGDDFKMKFYAVMDRFLLRQFNKVVAVSEGVREKICKSGVPSRKTVIVQNGITVSRFDACHSVQDIKNNLGISNGYTVIGTVGRISVEKGHINLLKIANNIVEQFPETIFLIIGDGPLRKDLQKRFNSSSIIFTGTRNDIPDLYHCMDIFVLPSFTEGLPMVILEAMASSLPVVATRVGEVPALIKDKENGLIVKPGDEDDLKESLLYLLKNPCIAKAMGKKGYLIVKECFSSNKMAKDYVDIYKELTR